MIVIQMFICSRLQDMEGEVGGRHRTVGAQIFSVFREIRKSQMSDFVLSLITS